MSNALPNELMIVVPARGGSQRIPNKNIASLNGKPLLTYTLEAAIDAGFAEVLYVSTDSELIADVARKLGVNVIMRPAELATATASTEQALIHALNHVSIQGYSPQWLMTLQATSPFRHAKIIQEAWQKIKTNGEQYDCLMTVTESREDIWLMNKERQLNRIFANAPRRQQDREPFWIENSALYLTRVSVLQQTNSILGHRVLGVPMSVEEGWDINTPFDWKIAEQIIINKMNT